MYGNTILNIINIMIHLYTPYIKIIKFIGNQILTKYSYRNCNEPLMKNSILTSSKNI